MYLYSLLSLLMEKSRSCVVTTMSVSVFTFSFWNSWNFTKSDMNAMPLESVITYFFVSSYNRQYQRGGRTNLRATTKPPNIQRWNDVNVQLMLTPVLYNVRKHGGHANISFSHQFESDNQWTIGAEDMTFCVMVDYKYSNKLCMKRYEPTVTDMVTVRNFEAIFDKFNIDRTCT
jgi:hypothetical protein